MFRSAVMVLSLVMCLGPAALAQRDLDGVVNEYRAVTRVMDCDSTVEIEQPDGIRVGDRVLLIQMKGATVETANTQAYGSLVTLGGAGAWEFLTVQAVRGGMVTFAQRFVHAYDARYAVQLVRVPSDPVVRIRSTVRGRPFDGRVGGVVALDCAEAIEIDGTIDADGIGFRGGRRGGERTFCDDTSYVRPYTDDASGEKGESMVAVTGQASRGPLLTGGGGGNTHNAGGAGGGNGGRGGHGGRAGTVCRIFPDVGGIGGHALGDSTMGQRAFLGGGGGGGHENQFSYQGRDGANGGGVVILRTATLRGTGRITADGDSLVPDPVHEPGDGSGGGGAGGTVVLLADAVPTPLVVRARGGRGGDVAAMYQPAGPGGGGGGGVVVLNRPHPRLQIDLRGGGIGRHISRSNPGSREDWGARPGSDGIVLQGLTLRTPPRQVLLVEGPTTMCPGDTVRLSTNRGFTAHRWSDGTAGPVLAVTTPGTYSVTALDSGGCLHRVDGIVVRDNSTRLTVATVEDWGECNIEQDYDRTIPVRNTDDEPITITAADLPSGFTLVSPPLPVTIPVGAAANFVVRFRATDVRPYRDDLRLTIGRPCAAERRVTLVAAVRPILVHVGMPDTTATVGTTGFGMPVAMVVAPDTVDITGADLTFDIVFDGRVFAPDTVIGGRITRNIIDLIGNRREMTIAVDDLALRGGTRTVIATIVGTVLSSPRYETPFVFGAPRWEDMIQVPMTSFDDGHLYVIPECFGAGRAIRTYGASALSVAPNPAADVVSVSVSTSVPGTYSVSIMDVSGRDLQVHTFSVTPSVGPAPVTPPVMFNIGDMDSGLYLIRYRTPVATHIAPVVVRR